MPTEKSQIRKAAGMLTLAIQKEWMEELGLEIAELSEDVMNTSHDFLHSNTQAELSEVLGTKSITEYLGAEWVSTHPKVIPFIEKLESSQ